MSEKILASDNKKPAPLLEGAGWNKALQKVRLF